MSQMYLSQVGLKDFRAFGEFMLDIAPGPGLTLLIGSNGLGKSSFLDAIEWCLTGRVQRLEDHVGRFQESSYLTRRDVPKNGHSVSLTFGQRDIVTRTGSTAPDASRVAHLLKSEEWAPIADLSSYLNFTHFLGQAASQRFTSRNAKDQWEALKAPSGIDRLEAVRSALRGRTTSVAFGRRIEREGAAVLAAERALMDWRKMRDRLDRMLSVARATGDMTIDSLDVALVDLEKAIRAAGLRWRAPITEDHAARLGSARAAIDEGLQATADRRGDVERLSVMAARYSDLVTDTERETALADAAVQTVSAATAALSEAALATGEAERAVKAESLTASEAFAKAQRLLEARNVRGELERLRADVSRSKEDLARLNVEVNEANTIVEVARQLATRQQTRARFEARQVRAEEMISKARDLEALSREIVALRAEDERARQAAAEAEVTVKLLRLKVAELREEIAAGRQVWQELQRRASEMAEALATIAKHVSDHDEACPVCSTSFPHGVLKRLAATTAAAEDVALAERARVNEAAEAELGAVLNSIAVAEATMLAPGETSATLARAAAVEAANRSVLATDLRASAEQDLMAMAIAEREAAHRSLLAIAALPAEPSANLGEAEARLGAALAREREAVERAELMASAVKMAEARLLDLGVPDEGVIEMSALIEAEHQVGAQARARQGVAETVHAAALATEAAARRRLSAAASETERVRAALVEARRERDQVQARWAAAGLADTPSSRGISLYVEQLASEEPILQTLAATAARLGAALRDLATESELGALRDEMVMVAGPAGAADPVEHEASLLRELDSARGALRVTEEAQAGVKAYSEQLKSTADRFSTQFLMPLNDLIEEFNKALLNAPGETVQFSATHAVDRTNLSMRLRYADRLDDSRYDTGLSPYLVMSEGQLAANGLSILCAASTAYPWSDWRALLLDDPLQHNDIVHASAFVDVMRNLVEFKGYQLLMSSHDRAEGEFLFRKFDAANLPCTMVTLTAPSRNGVLSEPPRRNAAASRLFANRLAATG